MEIMETIQKYREEMNIKQTEINNGFISTSRYSRLESGIHKPFFEEIVYFSQKLGIRLPELLFHANLTNASDYEFVSKKEYALNFITNYDKIKFEEAFNQAFNQRNQNLQYYSIYILYLYTGTLKEYDQLPSNNKIIRDLKKFYKNRTNFLAADYEILGNLSLFFPLKEINFLIEILFPVKDSGGNIRDSYVQITIKNISTIALKQKNFPLVKKMINEFNIIRSIPDIVMNGYFDLEMVYFEHLSNFVETRKIDSYIKAMEIIQLFKSMNQNDYYNALLEEITEIADEHNFKINIPSLRLTEINQHNRVY